MKALIFNNKVEEIVADGKTFEVCKEMFWVDCPADCTTDWIYDPVTKKVTPPVIPPKTKEEIKEEYNYAIREYMNSKAGENGYDNINSMISYANGVNPEWKIEASKAGAFRDACWLYCFGWYEQIDAGKTPPAVSEFISRAPKYESF